MRIPALLAVTALTACSQEPRRESKDLAVYDVRDGSADTTETSEMSTSSATRSPDISPTAAPGVAFNYNYAFRLENNRIAPVQEAHARMCETLGVDRCRITGMRYRLLGENNIEAALDFKLAPELARGFGQRGIAGVEQAGGRLVDAEITGTDAGAVITSAGTERARAADELRRLDEAIARARNGTERAELQAQRAEIARRIEAAQATTAQARDSLAQTPVNFLYESGPAVRGFDTSAPITSALDTAVGSAQATFAVLLGIIAIFGPPALAIGLALWLFFQARAWWRRRRPAAAPVQAGTGAAPPAG